MDWFLFAWVALLVAIIIVSGINIINVLRKARDQNYDYETIEGVEHVKDKNDV